MLLASLTTAGAATVVQTQDITNLGNFGQSYSWNAFDTDLGTLTSAVLVVNGTYSGSVEVYAPDYDTSVNALLTRTELNLQRQGVKGSSVNDLPFNGYFAPQGSTTTFTIQNTGVTFNTGDLVPSSPSDYFTNTSFTSRLTYSARLYISPNRSTSTSDTTNRRLNGTISLTYTYTPAAVEPVPEISTVTMGGAGGLLLLGIAARSRRRQQPSDSVPA